MQDSDHEAGSDLRPAGGGFGPLPGEGDSPSMAAPGPLRRIRNLVAKPPDPFLKSRKVEAKIVDFLAAQPPGRRIINIGAGDSRLHPDIVNLDIHAAGEVDVVGSALALPFASESADIVVGQGLLEHVRAADDAVREMARILAPGGVAYVEIPFMQPFHPSPSDYVRVTYVGIEELFRRHGFSLVEKGVQIGPGSALAWVFRDCLAAVVGGGSAWRYRKALTVAGWLAAPLRYLDRVVEGSPFAHSVASAFFYYGRKNGS